MDFFLFSPLVSKKQKRHPKTKMHLCPSWINDFKKNIVTTFFPLNFFCFVFFCYFFYVCIKNGNRKRFVKYEENFLLSRKFTQDPMKKNNNFFTSFTVHRKFFEQKESEIDHRLRKWKKQQTPVDRELKNA